MLEEQKGDQGGYRSMSDKESDKRWGQRGEGIRLCRNIWATVRAVAFVLRVVESTGEFQAEEGCVWFGFKKRIQRRITKRYYNIRQKKTKQLLAPRKTKSIQHRICNQNVLCGLDVNNIYSTTLMQTITTSWVKIVKNIWRSKKCNHKDEQATRDYKGWLGNYKVKYMDLVQMKIKFLK